MENQDNGSMAERILEFVKARDNVSFAELSTNIPGFDSPDGGPSYGVELLPNLFAWTGMSYEGIAAVHQLIQADSIHMKPASSVLIYLIDGMSLKFPLAKQVKAYKSPRWIPCILRPGPAPAEKPARKSKQAVKSSKKAA